MAIFHNNGDEKVYIMSAAWMTRNLDRRIEVGAPIVDKKIKRTLKDFFDIQWSDNEKARDLTIFGCNNYVEKENNPPCRAQMALYDFYKKMSEEK
jgi:polyphosphate kinase